MEKERQEAQHLSPSASQPLRYRAQELEAKLSMTTKELITCQGTCSNLESQLRALRAELDAQVQRESFVTQRLERRATEAESKLQILSSSLLEEKMLIEKRIEDMDSQGLKDSVQDTEAEQRRELEIKELKERLEDERARAESEAARAEAEKTRADHEKARAEDAQLHLQQLVESQDGGEDQTDEVNELKALVEDERRKSLEAQAQLEKLIQDTQSATTDAEEEVKAQTQKEVQELLRLVEEEKSRAERFRDQAEQEKGKVKELELRTQHLLSELEKQKILNSNTQSQTQMEELNAKLAAEKEKAVKTEGHCRILSLEVDKQRKLVTEKNAAVTKLEKQVKDMQEELAVMAKALHDKGEGTQRPELSIPKRSNPTIPDADRRAQANQGAPSSPAPPSSGSLSVPSPPAGSPEPKPSSNPASKVGVDIDQFFPVLSGHQLQGHQQAFMVPIDLQGGHNKEPPDLTGAPRSRPGSPIGVRGPQISPPLPSGAVYSPPPEAVWSNTGSPLLEEGPRGQPPDHMNGHQTANSSVSTGLPSSSGEIMANSTIKHKSVPELVDDLRNGPSEAEKAAHRLGILAALADSRSAILEEEAAVPLLIWILKTGTPKAKKGASLALGNLVLEEKGQEAMLMSEGGVDALLSQLWVEQVETVRHICQAINSIATKEKGRQLVSRNKAGVERLVVLLRSQDQQTAKYVAGALRLIAMEESGREQVKQATSQKEQPQRVSKLAANFEKASSPVKKGLGCNPKIVHEQSLPQGCGTERAEDRGAGGAEGLSAMSSSV